MKLTLIIFYLIHYIQNNISTCNQYKNSTQIFYFLCAKALKSSVFLHLRIAQFPLLNSDVWLVAATWDSTDPDAKIDLQAETEGKILRKKKKKEGRTK